MSQYVRALSAGTIATVLVGGMIFLSGPAEAAKNSKREQAILDHTAAQCTARAEARKLWLIHRKIFVWNCIRKDLKAHPEIDTSDFDPSR